MKQILLLLFFLASSLLAAAQEGKKLDNENANSMMPIVNGIYETIQKLEKENVEIVRIEFDRVIDKKTTTRRFVSGYTYGVMAYGDYKVKNMKIKVLKREQNNWVVLAESESTGASSIVHFKPQSTDNYRIDIEILEYHSPYSGCNYGLIIIHN